MPEVYFVSTSCSANASSASTRKKKHFGPCACAFNLLAFALMPALRPFSPWNKNYCVCACACVASENQASGPVHYAGGIWKGSFISTVWSTVYTNPSRNGTFRKRSSNGRKVKPPAFRFRVNRKHFENGGFWKRWLHGDHVIFLPEWFLNHKSKMTGDCCAFKFLRRSMDGEHVMCLQSEIAVFKFL